MRLEHLLSGAERSTIRSFGIPKPRNIDKVVKIDGFELLLLVLTVLFV